jgi:hypothetical protein
MPKNNKAIVTLVIGERYVNLWNKYCKSTWEPYAEQHGYDLVIIDEFIDTNKDTALSRSIHWQKLLILEHPATQGYDHLVWVDTDITMNYVTAPCIVESNNSDKVGVVQYNKTYSPEMFDGGFARSVQFNNSEAVRSVGKLDYPNRYKRADLPSDVDDMINTGVLVLSKNHRDLLREVYDTYKENPFSAKENIPLSYHLLKNDLCNPIDGRFNKILDLEMMHHMPHLFVPGVSTKLSTLFHYVNACYINSYFLHFIEGFSRAFMQMVIPGATFPAVTHYIEKNAPKGDFDCGKNKLAL